VTAFAVAAGYRPASAANPFVWGPALKELLGAKSAAKRLKRQNTGSTGHYPALAYERLPELMQRLRALDTLAARATEFAILCAARTGEVLGADWGEFDLAEAVWSIPASRMKAARPHRVPLPSRGVEILKKLRHRGGNKPFPLGHNAMLRCLADVWGPGLTTHGVARSTFVDWCHEQSAFPATVINMCLAHVVAGVEGSYRRGDLFERRRALMEQWSRYCESPPREESTANVTPIRPGAKVTP
jgi:integrase